MNRTCDLRFRALRGLGEKRLILLLFGGRLGQLVAELHVLGGRRAGCVRSDLGDEGKSPNTKQ
jgi:hypothetical protein